MQKIKFLIKSQKNFIFLRKTSKIKKQQHKTDEDKIKHVETNEIPTENGNSVMYKLSNATLASTFKDTLTLDNKQLNSISMVINNNNLKSVTLDLSNYISSITGTTHTLTINMEYANIGTTENFDIKIN